MEGLHQVMRGAAIFFVLGCFHAALAADYCSLVVRVVSPDGRRPFAIVSVLEKNGRLTERDPTPEDVRFCDLGIGPVTVKVGADGTCNQVVVKDVPLMWQEQYLLTVTYDLEPCLEDPPPAPVPVCQVLFRISDSKGNWLEKASIHFQGSGSAPLETDRAGRALRLLKAGDRVTGAVESRGYVSKTFSVSCSRSEPVHEESVKLERSPGQ